MRVSAGGCGADGRCYSSARRLLGGDGGFSPAVASSSPAPPASLDAQRARLATALCATTAVLFAASLSYVAISALLACFRAARRPERPPDAAPGPPGSDAAETKRALQEIPVVVVPVRNDPDRSRVEGADAEKAAAAGGDEECAVCLAAYAGGEEVRVLPWCGHGFHRECVDRWLLTRAPTCPVCRSAVVAASSEGRHAKGCATGDAVSRVGA